MMTISVPPTASPLVGLMLSRSWRNGVGGSTLFEVPPAVVTVTDTVPVPVGRGDGDLGIGVNSEAGGGCTEVDGGGGGETRPGNGNRLPSGLRPSVRVEAGYSWYVAT